MKVRVYPEGNARKAKAYEIHETSSEVLGSPAWTNVTLVGLARVYAEEEGADDDYAPMNLCVEPIDDEARALPGWHPAEPPTADDEEEDDPPRPFRLFVVRAQVEVEWSAAEVQTFNPFNRAATRRAP